VGVVAIIVIIVAVALVIVAAVWWFTSRRGSTPAGPPPVPAAPRVERPEPPPMTGLEEALNRATDRSGTSLADRLDAEAEVVEGFRVSDDTGPLLRRALDRLEPADADAETPERGDAAGEQHSET
jgi:hypothetical protein